MCVCVCVCEYTASQASCHQIAKIQTLRTFTYCTVHYIHLHTVQSIYILLYYTHLRTVIVLFFGSKSAILVSVQGAVELGWTIVAKRRQVLEVFAVTLKIYRETMGNFCIFNLEAGKSTPRRPCFENVTFIPTHDGDVRSVEKCGVFIPVYITVARCQKYTYFSTGGQSEGISALTVFQCSIPKLDSRCLSGLVLTHGPTFRGLLGLGLTCEQQKPLCVWL